ncbi:phage terminase large subunit [Hyphomonas sp. WL0036]|uniref:phage terminase large subunit n=1 Tax=Hyphomonas sediminis TaxID=2866160 RepID=UPI001C7FCBE6|nr:phage terminase large subunit [Hyphomonas sediminis]MBY9068245.1 phage terminase large subunit [Hyphomonas sediminis]
MVDPNRLPNRAFLKKETHSLFRSDFRSLIRKAFRCAFPSRPFQDNWHIESIGYHLQMVAEGKLSRLMISVPPRSLKSFITSVVLPLFIIGNDPTKTVLVISHSLDLATKLSNQFRQLISHPEIQEIFPAFSGALSKDSEREITTLQGGGRIAASVDSNVTGRGGDIIIIDDPLDASDADNELACNNVNKWLDETLSTRTNDPATTPIVLVMQRLSIFDPVAHLAEQEDWTQLSFPAIATRNEKILIGDALYHERAAGDLLHPDRYPRTYLDTQRKKMGARAFEAQFQQNPVPDGGGIIDLSKFRRYRELPKLCDLRFYSIDAASGSDSGSYSVIMGFRIVDGKLYLTNVARKRYTFPELCRLVHSTCTKFRPDHLVIERASNGYALIQHLNEKLEGTHFCEQYPYFVQGINPHVSKIVRMEQALVAIEEGKVLLPENADWLSALESELRAFPNGRYDDQADALSQAVKFFTWYMQQPFAEERKRGFQHPR